MYSVEPCWSPVWPDAKKCKNICKRTLKFDLHIATVLQLLGPPTGALPLDPTGGLLSPRPPNTASPPLVYTTNTTLFVLVLINSQKLIESTVSPTISVYYNYYDSRSPMMPSYCYMLCNKFYMLQEYLPIPWPTPTPVQYMNSTKRFTYNTESLSPLQQTSFKLWWLLYYVTIISAVKRGQNLETEGPEAEAKALRLRPRPRPTYWGEAKAEAKDSYE